MSDEDRARLDRILVLLGEGDRAWLRAQFEAPCLRRARRLAARDAAIRAALQQFFRNPHVTCAAKALARALSAYRASNWTVEKDSAELPATASGRHRALHAILRANRGRTLGWRRIVDICCN